MRSQGSSRQPLEANQHANRMGSAGSGGKPCALACANHGCSAAEYWFHVGSDLDPRREARSAAESPESPQRCVFTTESMSTRAEGFNALWMRGAPARRRRTISRLSSRARSSASGNSGVEGDFGPSRVPAVDVNRNQFTAGVQRANGCEPRRQSRAAPKRNTPMMSGAHSRPPGCRRRRAGDPGIE